jgi:2'-5' RNA ligase
MQPRYFIGITLPDTIGKKISEVQGRFLSGQDVMEALVPHITLLHPNILMTLSPLYFIPQVKQVADDLLPIKIELAKTAMFDDRVLHIAVKSPELLKLQKSLVELLPDDIRARYEVGRMYTPHVTLAQAKPLKRLDPALTEAVKKQINPLLPEKFEAAQVSQFTWIRPRKYKIQTI